MLDTDMTVEAELREEVNRLMHELEEAVKRIRDGELATVEVAAVQVRLRRLEKVAAVASRLSNGHINAAVWRALDDALKDLDALGHRIIRTP